MASKTRVSFAKKSVRLSFSQIFVMAMVWSLLGSCGHELNIPGESGVSTGADGVGVQQATRPSDADVQLSALAVSESRDVRISLYSEATELPLLTNSAKGFRTELAFLNLSSESRARFGVQSQQRLQVYQLEGSLVYDKKAMVAALSGLCLSLMPAITWSG